MPINLVGGEPMASSGVQYGSDRQTIEQIIKGAMILRRQESGPSYLGLEPADDATMVKVSAPDSLTNGTYQITVPEDAGAAGQVLAVQLVSGRNMQLGWQTVWVEVTQAEYDALSPPDPGTLYLITE